ncbi:MAG: futalosine hydrolase [Bacteroidetes bacterium]|nr:futalosine hydrolase [Bacteroidota bacterium]MBU1718863.1 futalosine hydrolase [Bacteroidota bacterium]
MRILIVSAAAFELEDIVDQFIFDHSLNERLDRFRYQGLEIDTLYTGIGMVPTAYWLSKTLAAERYDCALNLGIAGSYSKKLQIGDVVNITSDVFCEMGAEDDDKFITLHELDLLDASGFPFIDGVLYNDKKCKNQAIDDLPVAKGATSNTIHGNAKSIKQIIESFNPDTESMEGAAFFYVCLNENIPCAQVRSISNYVNIRDKDDWNIPKAIESLTEATIKILDCIDECE